MEWNCKKNVKFTRWTGILLIFTAIIILLISIIELKANEMMLTTKNLNIEKVWVYQGAFQWWQTTFKTTILPVSQILITTGIATILTSRILKIFEKEPTLMSK